MVLIALMNTIICSAIALVVMIELQFAYPNSRWPLGVGILVALIVWVWIAYNHKIRTYINAQGSDR